MLLVLHSQFSHFVTASIFHVFPLNEVLWGGGRDSREVLSLHPSELSSLKIRACLALLMKYDIPVLKVLAVISLIYHATKIGFEVTGNYCSKF